MIAARGERTHRALTHGAANEQAATVVGEREAILVLVDLERRRALPVSEDMGLSGVREDSDVRGPGRQEARVTRASSSGAPRRMRQKRPALTATSADRGVAALRSAPGLARGSAESTGVVVRAAGFELTPPTPGGTRLGGHRR